MKTSLKTYVLLSLACVFTFVLTACGGGSALTLTQENFDKLHDDMTPTEVRSILGQPSQSTTEPIPIVGGTQTTYVYENNSSQVTLVFKNDQLKEKRSNFLNDANSSTTTTPVPPAN